MKKNILFIESRYNSFYGAQKSMLQLIKALDTEYFDYKIVTTEEGNLKKGFNKENINVDIVKLGYKANVFGGKVLNYSFVDKLIVLIQVIILNFKILSYINRHKIDYIYVNDSRSMLYSIIASKLLNKKIIWYIRSDVTNSRITRFSFKHANQIITIAKGVLKDLPVDFIREHKDKITNIYTGFDFDKFKLIEREEAKKKLDILPGRKVIGYLGSINYRKGIDLLVESFIEMARRDESLELLIVGDVSEGHEEYWDELIDKLNRSRVNYKYIPYTSEVSKIYCSMDIFVLPSRAEGLPRVVIEAMAHKVPVVSTNVGGVREIIVDGENGFVIKENQSKELNEALETIIEDEQLSKGLSKAAYEQIKYKFSLKEFNENINKLLKNM